jgi:Protein of unknown function (DUF2380)
MTPRALLVIIFLAVPGPARVPLADPPVKVALLSIELINLHKTAPDSSLAGRIQGLGAALAARLAITCGYQVVPIDSGAQAAAHFGEGYLYDHPDEAAGLAAAAGADWVVVPRLNRATAWAADLQAHVVRVRDSTIISNRIVELKGLELGPELATRLELRGAAWMADQLSQAIEFAQHPGTSPVRRCSPNAP